MKICAKCGTQCEDRMKFCLNCGEPFAVAPAKEEAKPAEVVEVVEETVAKEVVPVSEEAAEVVEEIVPAVEETKTAVLEQWPEQIEDEVPVTSAEEVVAAQPEEEQAAKSVTENHAQKEEAAVPASVENPKKAKKKVKAEEYEADDEEYEEEDKPVSSLAVISLILSIIGVVAGGCGCILSFMNFFIALAFFVPSVFGLIFGLVAMATTGSRSSRSGKAMAIVSAVISILALALWIVAAFKFKGSLMAEFGNADIMTAIRAILSK